MAFLTYDSLSPFCKCLVGFFFPPFSPLSWLHLSYYPHSSPSCLCVCLWPDFYPVVFSLFFLLCPLWSPSISLPPSSLSDRLNPDVAKLSTRSLLLLFPLRKRLLLSFFLPPLFSVQNQLWLYNLMAGDNFGLDFIGVPLRLPVVTASAVPPPSAPLLKWWKAEFYLFCCSRSWISSTETKQKLPWLQLLVL